MKHFSTQRTDYIVNRISIQLTNVDDLYDDRIRSQRMPCRRNLVQASRHEQNVVQLHDLCRSWRFFCEFNFPSFPFSISLSFILSHSFILFLSFSLHLYPYLLHFNCFNFLSFLNLFQFLLLSLSLLIFSCFPFNSLSGKYFTPSSSFIWSVSFRFRP